MLTELAEKKVLQDAENISDFCDSAIDIFTEKNSCMEHQYKVQ
jgi:hypothetical protein